MHFFFQRNEVVHLEGVQKSSQEELGRLEVEMSLSRQFRSHGTEKGKGVLKALSPVDWEDGHEMKNAVKEERKKQVNQGKMSLLCSTLILRAPVM